MAGKKRGFFGTAETEYRVDSVGDIEKETIYRIEKTLVEHGAISVVKDYSEKKLTGISFQLIMAPQDDYLYVRLPFRIDYYKSDAGGDPQLYEKELWETLYQWISSSMKMVDNGLADMVEIFLPFTEYQSNITFYERFLNAKNTAVENV